MLSIYNHRLKVTLTKSSTSKDRTYFLRSIENIQIIRLLQLEDMKLTKINLTPLRKNKYKIIIIGCNQYMSTKNLMYIELKFFLWEAES